MAENKEFRKRKKREEEVRRKLENRRVQLLKSERSKIEEQKRERNDLRLENRTKVLRRKISSINGEQAQIEKLMPGPNKPCLCGSGKKFKKCCMRDIESGNIKLVAKEDPTLQMPEKNQEVIAKEV